MICDLSILALLWILWCFLHSFLITAAVAERLRKHLGRRYAWYRLFYNLFALLTLMPVVGWSFLLPYADLFVWTWPWTALQALLWAAAGALILAGARDYPLDEFLGLRQIRPLDREEGSPIGEKEEPRLVTDGVLGFVRHPWYLAALLVLWARDLAPQDLVTSAVLSAYLLIGACLEERKLIRVYGDAYRNYRQQVSMLVPLKWVGKIRS